MTKLDHNNNMLWYCNYFEVPDVKDYSFGFLVAGSDWSWWIEGESVSLTDAKPYAQGILNQGAPMKFTLTPGLYNVYLDIKTLNYMFVKTLPSAPAPAM